MLHFISMVCVGTNVTFRRISVIYWCMPRLVTWECYIISGTGSYKCILGYWATVLVLFGKKMYRALIYTHTDNEDSDETVRMHMLPHCTLMNYDPCLTWFQYNYVGSKDGTMINVKCIFGYRSTDRYSANKNIGNSLVCQEIELLLHIKLRVATS